MEQNAGVQGQGTRPLRPTEPTPPRKVLDVRPASAPRPQKGRAWQWWAAAAAGVAMLAVTLWWLLR